MVEKIISSNEDWDREPNEYERFLGDMCNILVNEVLGYKDSCRVEEAKGRYLRKLGELRECDPDDAVHFQKLYDLACRKLDSGERLGSV